MLVPDRLVARMTATAARDAVANYLVHLTQHLSLGTQH
jgi:uncharacterized membrane protein